MSKKTPAFFNRELSWLAFNRRVLDEACAPDRPLLARLKFLAITAANLDEFFMVRLGGLRQLADQEPAAADPAGLAPAEQLEAASREAAALVAAQYACLLQQLEPALAAAGLARLDLPHLSPEQAAYVEQLFEREIFPLLTPMALDPAESFPLLPGLTVNLFVRLAPAPEEPAQPRYAVVALPKALPRFLTLPAPGGYSFLLLEELVGARIDQLFPGAPVRECVAFRLTRNADLTVREDLAGDLLEDLREVLTERRQSDCLRLELAAHAGAETRAYLQQALALPDRDIYPAPGPVGLSAYLRLAGLPGFPALQEEPWPPQPPPGLRADESIFTTIARGDRLLLHPYESFEPVLRLINEAADDPQVLAIKQILYRTSENSPVVAALIRAAEREKHVTALVELKARFDEARNIGWATALERAGVQVIYGLRGLKVHAKACLVVRREPGGIRRYLHFGTGNYNERTAQLYSDVSLLTCDEDLGADASACFNAITGFAQPQRLRKLAIAPLTLRARLLELIANEAERSRQGQPAHIRIKLNALVDPAMIEALYEAGRAGVSVALNIRGICCLRPGVPGLSENISVVSLIDRYLEHARLLAFHNGGEPLVFLSSADWMPRNLDRRVELLVPVEAPAARARLLAILDTCLADTVQARRLLPDGSWERVTPAAGKRVKPLRAQELFQRQAVEAAQQADQAATQVFEPQRPA